MFFRCRSARFRSISCLYIRTSGINTYGSSVKVQISSTTEIWRNSKGVQWSNVAYDSLRMECGHLHRFWLLFVSSSLRSSLYYLVLATYVLLPLIYPRQCLNRYNLTSLFSSTIDSCCFSYCVLVDHLHLGVSLCLSTYVVILRIYPRYYLHRYNLTAIFFPAFPPTSESQPIPHSET